MTDFRDLRWITFLFSSIGDEATHLEQFGTYTLSAKVFGVCAQLEYLSWIGAHPENFVHLRLDDEIVEYELLLSEKKK